MPASLLGLYSLHAFHGIPWVGPLYLVEGLPFLVLLSSQGLAVLGRALGGRGLAALAVAALLASGWLLGRHLVLARERVAERCAPQAAAAAAGIERGVVFIRYEEPEHFKRFALRPPEPGQRLVFARDLGEANDRALCAALGLPEAWLYVPSSGELRPLP